MVLTPCIVGFDFGTTSLSAVVVNLDKKSIEKEICYTTHAYLFPDDIQRKEQSLQILSDLFFKMLAEINTIGNIQILSIGFTGQMHGIIGLNSRNEAVTNLVTWQDKSGGLLLPSGKSILEEVQSCSETVVAEGYGIITLYKWIHYDSRTDIVSFCTVADYFANLLAQQKPELMDATNAHSVGIFNNQTLDWDREAIRKLKLEQIRFPRISCGPQVIGSTQTASGNTSVVCAIGDNQASFLGSVINPSESILLNAGTGTQLSCLINKKDIGQFEKYADGFETQLRPYNETSCLLATSFTNGGSVYKALFNFFKETGIELFGLNEIDETALWERMEQAGRSMLNDRQQLEVSPLLDGQRSNPTQRGSIGNLSASNFHPGYLVTGFLTGLAQYYQTGFYPELRERTRYICASGNGLKRNQLFRQIIEKTFGCPLYTVSYNEEAAVGAALNGAIANGIIPTNECGHFLSELSESSANK